MDIDRVRYFNVFAETDSLVKAAEILHISQPALSKALKVLEREVGLHLVEADGRGLKLTEAGKRFRNESVSLLASLSATLPGHKSPQVLERFTPSSSKTVTRISVLMASSIAGSLIWRLERNGQVLASGLFSDVIPTYQATTQTNLGPYGLFRWYDAAFYTDITMTPGSTYDKTDFVTRRSI